MQLTTCDDTDHGSFLDQRRTIQPDLEERDLAPPDAAPLAAPVRRQLLQGRTREEYRVPTPTAPAGAPVTAPRGHRRS